VCGMFNHHLTCFLLMNLIDMVGYITKLTNQRYQLVSYLLPSWIRYVYVHKVGLMVSVELKFSLQYLVLCRFLSCLYKISSLCKTIGKFR
jgi:hypothetical protein